MAEIYIPKVKYIIGTKVYVSIGDLLIEGTVINNRLAFNTNRIEYLVKYLGYFADGMTHANWHFGTDLSNIDVA